MEPNYTDEHSGNHSVPSRSLAVSCVSERDGTRDKAVVTAAVPFSRARAEAVREWSEAKLSFPWKYAADTDAFVYCARQASGRRPVIFARASDGGWLSFNDPWTDFRLDTQGGTL